MKRILLIAFLFNIVFCSCSKKDNDNEDTAPAQNYSASVSMTGKIDSRTWVASKIDANVYKLSDGKLELVINGMQEYNNELVTLVLEDFSLTAKGYELGTQAVEKYQQYSKKNDGVKGNVVIAVATRESLKGNYWFNTSDGTKVEGIFTVAPVYNY